MNESALEIRRATPRDAAGLAELFQLVYDHSSHPCKDPGFVFGALARGDLWHVAIVDGVVVACLGMVAFPWNQFWEISRGVTHPDFRGGGLATKLAQNSIDDACASPFGDLIFGFPRIRTMYRIISETVTPGMHATGHDGAINIANGVREYHLFSLVTKPGSDFQHIIPDHSSLADSAFVANRVFAPLDLRPARGSYPGAVICGQSVSHPDLKPLSFGYDPFCPSDSLEITAYTGGSRHPAVIATEIDDCINAFAYARHVRMAVLVDKVDVIRELRARGFKITAYLPAWYHQDRNRFDCVLLVRTKLDVEPTDYGLRPWIDEFSEGFSA